MEVAYIKCPHCHTGWYGKELDVEIGEDGIVTKFVIEGINPTNIMLPIRCMNCGKYYIPIKEAKVAEDEEGNQWLMIRNEDGSRPQYMEDWVADRLINCKM